MLDEMGGGIDAVVVSTPDHTHFAATMAAMGEWTDAIRGDGPLPGSNFDCGANLTEVALLGVIVQRFGGRIEYDAAAMKIINRPELNAHLRIEAREGWRYGESL